MRYLGIDWGLRSIGLALSEGELSSPLTTLQVNSLDNALDQIRKIIDSESIDVIVLGKPESGESLKLVEKAQTKMLSKGWTVETVDETLSTQQAQDLLITQGVSKKARGEDNSMAAVLILQNYLDEKVG